MEVFVIEWFRNESVGFLNFDTRSQTWIRFLNWSVPLHVFLSNQKLTTVQQSAQKMYGYLIRLWSLITIGLPRPLDTSTLTILCCVYKDAYVYSHSGCMIYTKWFVLLLVDEQSILLQRWWYFFLTVYVHDMIDSNNNWFPNTDSMHPSRTFTMNNVAKDKRFFFKKMDFQDHS